MTGYAYDYSMSNNAIDAYGRGLVPKSEVTASLLKSYGWKHSKDTAVALIELNYWRSDESHHTSSWYNETNFYSIESFIEEWNELDNSDQQERLLKAREHLLSKQEGLRVKGSYSVFSGTRNHPKYNGKVEFTGIKRGSWIYMDNSNRRKKADGNHINYTAIFPEGGK